MIRYSNNNNNNINNSMAVQDIDFEGAGGQSTVTNPAPNPNGSGNPADTQDDVTNLGGDDVTDLGKTTEGDGTNPPKDTTKTETDKDNDNPSTGELAPGDTLEIDGATYTVAENGDIVDDKGNVFKEAKDVAEWLKSVNVSDGSEEDAITISALQEALGVEITDENGKTVTFADTPDGVKAYVNAVIENQRKEIQDATLNRLYQDNPLLKQFQDYVQLKGTPRGFGDIPDRSGIKLDKNNEQQLVAVIKMAAQEFGNKSLNDNYIKYLRDSGGLYDEAQAQLTALVEKDKEVRKDIETKAAQQRAQAAADTKAYWERVHNAINSRIIAGYRIPDSFTKEVDGKKVVITPDDFFDFVSIANKDSKSGDKITGYQLALENLSDEDLLNRDILDAWLMFTGGTYKDLIDMAVKEDKVHRLKVKSKQNRSNATVKVIKQQTGKTGIDDIIF